MTEQAAQVEETTQTQVIDETVVATQTQEESAPQSVDTTETEQPKKEDGVQKRINKITADKWTEKRRADALQAELETLRANSVNPVSATVEPVMPLESEFDYDTDKHNAAVAKYHSDVATNATNKAIAANASKTAQDANTTRLQSIQDSFWKKAQDANIEGFDTALSSLPTFDPQILEVLMQSENAPEVAIHLSRHLDVADTLVNSSLAVAAMKIGEISARLANTTQTNKVSNAPDPMKTINQGGAATGDEWDKVGGDSTFE